MLKLVFFQNCISPHQMPYIEVLSRREDVEHVWVIAPRLAYDDRAAMGWPKTWTSSTEKMSVEIWKEPFIDTNFRALLRGKNGEQIICLFSGITAFPEVEAWFKESLKYNVKRGIITEAPYTYNKPLWLHKVKFLLKDYRYVKYFDYVFAIGEECEKYYKGWSKRWKVVPFLYCTKAQSARKREAHEDCVRRSKAHEGAGLTKATHENEEPQPSFFRHRASAFVLEICFVGSLDRRKNVAVLLEALSLIKKARIKVTIVGDGPEKVNLEHQSEGIGSNIELYFVGAKPMDEAQKIIAENDVLVLPSLHDGWGAVVNEAMAMGTIPLCSDKCGAKALIKKSGYGDVFDVRKPEELAGILEKISGNIEEIRLEREKRIEWAEKNISPKAVADLFMSSL